MTPEIRSIAAMSEISRLLFSKELAEVSSSITEVTESLVVLGRTTIRLAPRFFASLETRREMLPVRLKIKMILATPMAMPRQVRKERVRFSRIEVRASRRWVRKSDAISVSSFCRDGVF